MIDLILIIFSAALVNNIIVLEVIGADPALAFLRRQDIAFHLSITMLVLLPVVTGFIFLLDYWLIIPLNIEYLQLIITVTVILCILYGLKATLPCIHHNLSESLEPFLPFAGINTTVLGTVLFSRDSGNNFISSVAFATGTALGFSLILILLTAIRERLEAANVPGAFQGIPVLLLTLSIIAMAFSGFTGLIVI